MRELTKSIGSFSWALSLFGARQALTFLRRPLPGPDHPATVAFDRVARSAGTELGGWLRGVYEAGDRAQRTAVDLFFSAATLGDGDLGSLGRRTTEALEAAGKALASPLSGGGSGGSGAGGGSGGSAAGAAGGWGPMPPLPDVPELRGGDDRGSCG